MSDANVTLVQNLYSAFGRGEIATIVKAATADCRWEVVGRRSDFPTLGRFQGQAGVGSFFEAVGQHLDFKEFSPAEFYPAGDKVFVLGRYAMTIRKTGKPMASEWCHVFTIRDGKVAGFREFTDTAQVADAYRG